MKPFIDRKRAASGESEEGMVLAPVESLVAALKAPRMEQHSSAHEKLLTEPLKLCQERRGHGWYTKAPGVSLIARVSKEHPVALAKTKSFHLSDDREFVVELGPSDRTDQRSMVIADVEWDDLSKDPMPAFDSLKVLEKHHPMVYSMRLDRSELSTNTVVFEMGLYSRLIGQEHRDYIGRAKIFFPRPYTSLLLFINLSKIT